MPNYNTQLQSNNTDLQAILNTINGLPEAGGGTQVTPVISIDSTNGLITATAGTKSSTYQLTFEPAKTVYPTNIDYVAVQGGRYLGGDITVGAVPTQTKTVTPSATTQEVKPSAGYFFSKVTVNGDSNLVAGNIKSGVSIFGVSGTLEEGSGSGEQVEWSANENAIIEGTLSNYTNYTAKTIKSSMFYYDPVLEKVNFLACETINGRAFQGCAALTTANFPVCTEIGYETFYGCSSLTTASFPACTTIDQEAFYKCSSLTTVSFPACTTIKSKAFYSCSKLNTIILTGSSLCSLVASNAFSGTSIWSTKGSIFVPASLVASYKAATNWAFFSNRIYGV